MVEGEREKGGERGHTGAQGCTGTVCAYRDCSAASAGAKRSLARPPPRGGLVTSAILSVRRATAVYTISTFWQRRRHRCRSARVKSPFARRTINDQLESCSASCPLHHFPPFPRPVVANSVRRSVIRTGHAFRTDYGFLSVREDASSSPPASSTRSRVLLSVSARRSATLPK